MSRYMGWIRSLWLVTCVVTLSLCWALPSFAQQQTQDFLASCGSQSFCKPGLICAGGICVHECDTLQQKCPHGEPCKIQPSGKGACYCTSHDQCPNGTSCNGGQCSGNGGIGDLCDLATPCSKTLFCAKPSDATESRCLPICTGLVCTNGQSPCVTVPDSQVSVCYCNENAHCPNGLCLNGVCKSSADRGEECTRQIGCSSGLKCVFETSQSTVGRCHPTCSRNEDCVGGEQCVIRNNARVCLCDFVSTCRTGFACSNGLCTGYKRCSTTEPCPGNTACYYPVIGRSTGVCVDVCTQDKQCADGTPCLTIASSNTRGCYCRQDSHCPARDKECVTHQCRLVCFQTSQCPLHQLCKGGYCVLPGEGDVLPERQAPEPTPDGGVIDLPPREPPCVPACEAPQRCNRATGKCEKLGIGEGCEKNSDCQSGLCFGPGFPKPNICTVADCSKCAEYALECQTHGGKQACYRREITTPTPDSAPPKETCGCATTPVSPTTWLLLVLLCGLVSFRRKAA